MITPPSFDNVLWRKSGRSTDSSACVEVASSGHVIAVRDSKNSNSHVLVVAPSEWANFLAVIQISQ
jgi:hypothetical protein